MPPTSQSEKQAHIKSASRVLDILEFLASESRGMTVSEIASGLGIPRSSAHGLVHALLRRGYLAPDHSGSKRFRLGVRLIQLGLNVAERLELRAAARPTLERLVSATHDTALMVVPEDAQLLYVDKVLSDARNVRTDPRLSASAPFHSSSLGKALLAALADDAVEAFLDQVGTPRFTSFTITKRADLLRDLEKTRERGYSLDLQETAIGICCVGAPVRDYTGHPVAAISLSTIREYFNAERSGPAVAEGAVDISRAMGWDGELSTLFLPVPAPTQTFIGGDGRRADSQRVLAETKGV